MKIKAFFTIFFIPFCLIGNETVTKYGPTIINKQSIENLNVYGPTTISSSHINTATVRGPFKAKNSNFDELHIDGMAKFSDVKVNKLVVNGLFKAENSTFNEVTILSNKLKISNTKINHLIVTKNHATVVLANESHVDFLKFEFNNGKVILDPNSTVKNLEGGQITTDAQLSLDDQNM